MLKDIREFLKTNGPSETVTVARSLNAAPSAVQGMLEFLEARGQVRRMEIGCGGGCSGCKGCADKQNRRANDGSLVVFWASPE